MTDDFANIRVTTEYGKTVGWKILAGRDFSKALSTDSSALILNEAAVKYMGLTDPVGEIIRFSNKNHTVIGVIKDMVMQSPYSPVKQSIFYIAPEDFGYVILRIRPNIPMRDALHHIEAICKTYSPSTPFSFKFSDEEYAKKFNEEERIAKLSSFFAALAIFISCLGLFGMASFMAEQRIKEIGIRKVLGATVFNLWGLLSKDFVQLAVIALFIAIPVSYYSMTNWLLRYEYRTTISWSVFVWAALGAVLITLLTVSYQSIRAALMNPTTSLKSE
jgi:putative ABC transport system permease protein